MVVLSGDREGERRRPAGVGKKRGKQIVHFVGDAIELVAESIVQREIGKNLESVLGEGAEVFLAESAEIIGGTIAALVEELRLGHRSCLTEPPPNHVLQRGVRVYGWVARHKGSTELAAEVCVIIEIQRGPLVKPIGAVGVGI